LFIAHPEFKSGIQIVPFKYFATRAAFFWTRNSKYRFLLNVYEMAFIR
jgi:hypothetical protein